MRSSYFELDSADQLSRYRVPYLLRDQFHVRSSSLFIFFAMNKRKDSASRQPGIDSFFSKSQRTEGNGGADKAACPRRPANVGSGHNREVCATKHLDHVFHFFRNIAGGEASSHSFS